MIELEPLGEFAWLARFATDAQAQAWARSVRAQLGGELADVVAAYQTVGVHAKPDAADLVLLERRLLGIEPVEEVAGLSPTHVIPVLYNGPDLGEVARRLGLSVDQVVEAHSGQVYRVVAMGFLPGFPYLGYLPKSLQGIGRHAEPRKLVAAGSVAIAGLQTGVYPRDSPGGWMILGQTPLVIADPAQGWFPMAAGDQVRFRPIDATTFDQMKGRRLGSEDQRFEPDVGGARALCS